MAIIGRASLPVSTRSFRMTRARKNSTVSTYTACPALRIGITVVCRAHIGWRRRGHARRPRRPRQMWAWGARASASASTSGYGCRCRPAMLAADESRDAYPLRPCRHTAPLELPWPRRKRACIMFFPCSHGWDGRGTGTDDELERQGAPCMRIYEHSPMEAPSGALEAS